MSSSVVKVLIDAFRALRKFPKLFLPKILIAALYGFGMLLTAGFFNQLIPLLNSPNSLQNPALLSSISSNALLLLAFLFFVMVLDVLFNAAYSVMVRDFLQNNRIAILSSFKAALRKFFVIIPAALTSLIVFLVIALPIAVLASFALLSKDFAVFYLAVFLVLVLDLILTVAFYSMYPVSIFEKQGFFGVLKKSVIVSRQKFSKVFWLSLFSLLLSVFGIVFSFLAGNAAFFALFVLFRFLTALLATYQIILNPVFYLEFVRKLEAKA